MKLGLGKPQTKPRITEKGGEFCVADMADGTEAGYKYFEFQKVTELRVTYRGTGRGALEVRSEDKLLGNISIIPNVNWTGSEETIAFPTGVHALYLRYRGSGTVDFLGLEFRTERQLALWADSGTNISGG